MTAVIERDEFVTMREYKQLAGNITVRMTVHFVDDEFADYKVERTCVNAIGKETVIENRFEQHELAQAIGLFQRHLKEIL